VTSETRTPDAIPADGHYIHGAEPAEQSRLALLNDFLNERCLTEMHLEVGERVLDVGSGLGQFTRAMARKTQVSAVGVERDARQLARAAELAREAGESDLVEFREGLASNPPVPSGQFDVAHARFVLEHVSRPLDVVSAMARAVRPGGRVILADDDHAVLRLHPQPPAMREAWDAYIRSYERLGNDPYVGSRLVELLHRAGLAPTRSTWIFFGACAGEPAFPLLVENFAGILEGARETIMKFDLLAPSAFDAAISELRRWGERPDAALWYAVSWAEGTVPR